MGEEARKRLWREHLGVLGCSKECSERKAIEEKLDNPGGEECWAHWKQIAHARTLALDEMGHWPSTNARTWERYQEYRARQQAICQESDPVPRVLRPEPGKPRPLIAEFPLDFLVDED